ncbi:hypothetical protein [Mastigocladopsis repens]|uniref:hypothetical protein n=1 Tax=Mastigocladopsis repens TaxID=221287 RepID=UPI0002D7F321|nr:hypothetical protein [Mastigocladopsis repens]
MNSSISFIEAVEECIQILDGAFKVDVSGSVPTEMTIRSAIVSLPPGEIGIVNRIEIIGPEGEIEYQCNNIRVSNGTDLIRECGGPAVLRAGETTYRAEGSEFEPHPDVTFCISLDTYEGV